MCDVLASIDDDALDDLQLADLGLSVGHVEVPQACQRTLSVTDADTTVWGPHSGYLQRFGMALGDLDNDGNTDLMTIENHGRTGYVFYGPLPAGPVLASAAPARLTGSSVTLGLFPTPVGDLDGDGDDDVAFRQSRGPGDAHHVGMVSLVSTGPRLLGTHSIASVAWAELRGRFDKSFRTVDGGFDYNGDGHDDLFVDAHTNLAGAGDGWAYIINGPLPTGTWDAFGEADVTFRQTAPAAFAQTGAVRDLDGDGTQDLALSSWGVWTSSPIGGEAAVVLGPLSGHTNLPAGADGVITAPLQHELGRSTGFADFDGDGAVDRVLGASMARAGGTGRVYVAFGGPPQSGPADTTADLVIEGSTAGGLFGYTVATGDFSGDGAPDLAVASHRDGSTVGTLPTPAVHVFFSPGPGALSEADADVTIEGVPGEDLNQVVNLGDTNGDGFDDLALTSRRANDPARPSEAFHGATYVFLGPL